MDVHSVEVNGETITAYYILIATDGRPTRPSIPEAEYGIDSDGFFALEGLPKRTAIVGAGYTAVEIAGL
ncbi:MAG: FAD-dependent oxidoreductase [Candidatus Malihini olakiniferum]